MFSTEVSLPCEYIIMDYGEVKKRVWSEQSSPFTTKDESTLLGVSEFFVNFEVGKFLHVSDIYEIKIYDCFIESFRFCISASSWAIFSQ